MRQGLGVDILCRVNTLDMSRVVPERETDMKSKATKITIERGEGLIAECVTREFTAGDVWAYANTCLLGWAATAPKDGSYHKCRFAVEFENGETYSGRYDLVHTSCGFETLQEHIVEHIAFHLGEKRPAHMTHEQYGKFLAEFVKPEDETELRTFARECEVPGLVL